MSKIIFTGCNVLVLTRTEESHIWRHFSKLWQKVLGMDLDMDLFPLAPVPSEIAWDRGIYVHPRWTKEEKPTKVMLCKTQKWWSKLLEQIWQKWKIYITERLGNSDEKNIELSPIGIK